MSKLELCHVPYLTFVNRAKYGLAVVEHLLQVFGKDLGIGYDVGCKFGTTVARSELGPVAAELNFKSLVGSFHGHAHNRICQLSHLATYVPGIGLEDLEGCERLFSRSNALAGVTRHASSFHRRQLYSLFFQNLDLTDTYTALSKFLYNNYKQALLILDGQPSLALAMNHLGVTDVSTFHGWLEEERAYLQGLRKEPEQETLQLEYYGILLKLQAAECALALFPLFLF